MNSQPSRGPRLERLLGYLERDPRNPQLLADAASAAFDAHALDLAADLLARHETVAALPPALENLKGMVALASGDFGRAGAIFEMLLAASPGDATLRFNLAWTKAMTNDFRGTLDLLDEQTLAASPRAPALKVLAMHHLQMYDEALAEGEALAQRFPDNRALMGQLSTLALDAENVGLAVAYAERAGDNADGRTTLGTLALGNDDTAGSLRLFEEAIALQPGNPRAWVGKGLSLLADGNTAAATEALGKGAELFGDHLGSWIALGWTQFANGDNAGARAAFERALALDPNFSESHGGLAVMDILDGRLDEAGRRCDIALRLDRNCFGGALAKSMLLDKSGNARAAQRVRDIAMNVPIGPNGKTIMQALAGMAARPRR